MIVAIIVGLVGLLCLYVEFFVPGGVLAIIGAVILICSSIAFSLKADSWALGFIYVLSFLLAAVAICFFAMKNIKKSGKKNTFFLSRNQEGFTTDKIDAKLKGKTGRVSTELKPSGHVKIGGKTYQATSRGPFISKGARVEVIEVKGSHVIVKVIKE